ncbi:transferrin-binding protein-like solute binding protein [Sphingomonas sp.]|uniref:transferrin-binding protein-like solute binding protein n=1 Tax=Sphingomonas sp. TaxID=28214 RepID=UPI0035C8502D
MLRTLARAERQILGGVLIGAPTNPTELSGSGVFTYLAMMDEEENTANLAKFQVVTIDRATGKVSGTVSRADGSIAPVDFDLTGTLDTGNHIEGTIRSKTGNLTGTFTGRLFGPAGKEIALLYRLDSGTDYGILTGLKQ